MANSAVVGLLRVVLTANTAEFDTAMKRASDSTKQWSKDFQSIGAQASKVGEALTKSLTIPVLGLGAGALKMASDFESSFAGIRKTVGDATDALGNLTPVGEALAQGMRDLAKEIPINVNELNRIGEAAGQLGIQSDDILGFTKVMAELGVTTNLSSDAAATALARLANITQMPQTNFDRLGSTIVALGNNLATTESEIAEFGLRIAGAGHLAGLTEAQILAIGGAMSSVGVEAEAGGTAVQKVLLGITEAVASGNDDLQIFAETAGLSAEQFAEAWRTDAGAAFTAFVEGLGQQGDDAFKTLEALDLQDQRLVRSFLSLAGAGNLLRDSIKIGTDGWRDNVALTKEAEQRYRTFESQLKLFWAQVRDVGIELGQALLPTMRDLLTVAKPLIDMAASLVKGFSQLPDPIRLTAIGFAAVVAAAGPMIYAFGVATSTVGTLIGAFGTGGIAVRAFTAATAFAATSLPTFTAMVRGVGAALAVSTTQATVFTAVLAGLSTMVGIAAAAFAGWKLGTWIGQATGATDAVGKLSAKIGELVGILPKGTAAQYDAMRAAEQAKAANTALTGSSAAVADSTKRVADQIKQLLPPLQTSATSTRTATERLSEHNKEAEKAAQAAQRFRESVRSLTSVLVPYAVALDDAETSLHEVGASLHDLASGTLHETAVETEAARVATEQWADELGARLAPAIQQVGSKAEEAADKARSFGDSIRDAIGDLPRVIMRALEGGGDVGKSIGAMFGSKLFGEDSGLVKSLSGGLSKALGKTIGGALGSILPGLGTALGSGLGALVDKVFGRLFGGEGRKVNDLRDQFTSAAGGIDKLAKKAAEAGLTLERFYKAKTVKEYQAAIDELNAAFDRLDQRRETASRLFDEIMDAGRDGIPAAMKPAIDQLIALGLLTDEEVAKLKKLGDGSEVNVDQLKSDLDLIGGRLESLGPKFQQANIDKTAGQYVNAIDRMIAAGGDVGGILFDAREEIGKLVAESLKFGTTLPANMKPWIDELLRSGNLIDENGQKITDISTLKFGEAMETEGEKSVRIWEEIRDAIKLLVGEIRGPLLGAINQIPDEKRIKVGVDYEPGPTPGTGDPGFATGTVGRFGDFFANFGNGFSTKLHGWEAVVTPSQAPAFAAGVLESALSSGSTSSVTNTSNVSVMPVPIFMTPKGASPYESAREAVRHLVNTGLPINEAGITTALEDLFAQWFQTYGANARG